jgi:multisubunit Na+/H+ antiporter MnhE subunit
MNVIKGLNRLSWFLSTIGGIFGFAIGLAKRDSIGIKILFAALGFAIGFLLIYLITKSIIWVVKGFIDKER